MKRKDVFVLNWLFASLYFPISMLLWFFDPQGTILGVLTVGVVFHAILTILLIVMVWGEEQKHERIRIIRVAPENDEADVSEVVDTDFFEKPKKIEGGEVVNGKNQNQDASSVARVD